ncbi:gustatory receptor [Homalodisca vitripennis]|nr:gustatory receptor [Homalodisca vitripennis]
MYCLLGSDSKYDFLCISEHWLLADEAHYLQICVAIYACVKTFMCNVLDFEWLCDEINFKCVAVEVENSRIIVVSIYHSPVGDKNIFFNNLELLLKILAHETHILIGGDVNSKFDVTRDQPKRHTSASRIKALIRDYWLQCDTVREVNAFYGDQLLAVVVTSFFSTLISLSAFVIYFTEDNMTGTIVAGIWSFSHIAFLLLMAYLGTNVTVSADEMVRTVCRLINMEIDDELRDQAFAYWTLGSDDSYPLLLEMLEKSWPPLLPRNHDTTISSTKFNNVTIKTVSHNIFPRLSHIISTLLNTSLNDLFQHLIDRPADYDTERQSVFTGHTVTVTVCRSIYSTCKTLPRDNLLCLSEHLPDMSNFISRQSVVTGHAVTVTVYRSIYPTCETLPRDNLYSPVTQSLSLPVVAFTRHVKFYLATICSHRSHITGHSVTATACHIIYPTSESYHSVTLKNVSIRCLGLVRKVLAQGRQVADDSISAEDFNSFFIESVSEVRNNMPQPSTSSEDSLHRAKLRDGRLQMIQLARRTSTASSLSRKYSKFLDVCNALNRFDHSLQLKATACGLSLKTTAIIAISIAALIIARIVRIRTILTLADNYAAIIMNSLVAILFFIIHCEQTCMLIHFQPVTSCLAERFRMINTNITQEVDNDVYRQSMRQRNPPHLRHNHDRNVNDRINSLMITYHLLCDAVGQASDFYSDLLLASIVRSFLYVTSSLYFLFIHLLMKDVIRIISQIFWTLSTICFLCMVVSLSSEVTRAANETNTVVCKLITNTNVNPGLRKQLNSILLQVRRKHLEFSAGGCFHVNRQMLTSMATTVATNLVILIQFQTQPNQGD